MTSYLWIFKNNCSCEFYITVSSRNRQADTEKNITCTVNDFTARSAFITLESQFEMVECYAFDNSNSKVDRKLVMREFTLCSIIKQAAKIIEKKYKLARALCGF